ncbi:MULTISPECIES: YdbH domain-containing protein [unclassified Pseudodesulfovibrio]|uniref:intermembrane phospholipid transport protein YdbH family protein n=1 Tax=unclassified Pseudodesulfovibrio TaxID=2661612 RepID=UPI000FEB8BCB|nr:MULTISPECIES: YdbH domain-containing protein [unclassified Pseudodesulfovibrio]MCJ2164357.1 YdbH domain-containing protein [Pseudodesulfovibrio sp. S3-i]RWU04566.1 hypothetical protein DWB63_07360 [Pseudodesulfovibrio sp. S3]
MSASLGKKILRWTVLITPWLLAFALAAGWGLTLWTPGYLEQLVPKLASDMGLSLTEFNIRNAGLFSADIGPVQLGYGNKGLRLANVHVTYTPASLKLGRVNSVELDGVSLSCAYDGKTFTLPILDLLPESEGDPSDNAIPELPLDTLVIRESTLFCDLGDRSLSIPFSADIGPGESLDFTATLRPRDQMISVTGTLGPTLDDLALTVKTDALDLGAFADVLPIPVAGLVDLDMQTELDLNRPEELKAKFDAAMSECDLSALDVELVKGAVLKIKGSIAEKTVKYSLDRVSLAEPYPVTLDIPAGTLDEDSISAQFSLAGAGVEMGGRLDADRLQDDSGLWDISFTAANPDNLTVQAAGRTIGLAGFIFSLHGLAGPDSADVVLNCGTRAVKFSNLGLSSGAMRLNLPLKWPAPKSHLPGNIRMSDLNQGKHRLGNVTAQIRQQGTDLAYDGTLFTELLPGLRVPFSGQSSMVRNHTDITFRMNDYPIPDGFDPATLTPDMAGLILTGVLKGTGGLLIDENGIESWLGVFFTNGSLHFTEGKTAIQGINLAFETPDILSLRSAPAQRLTFDSLQAGDIILSNGEIIYQLEPKGSVLVEQAGFDWCGGHVSSRSFRVVPASKEYKVTLFCSELRLSEILSQLGLAKAKGEAAMSGELPVSWKNGKISFKSGFLHSTPGEGGTIQVEAMQDLVASIPEGTPQRGQIELAQAAVRDFEYKWVRIKADTVGEDLLVRLSVDGKPAGTLPFVYKREFGGFMRVTGDVKGSNFQGLRLDVNFSVPLDRILLYKDITRMIE